jgi:biotin carboxylase
MQVVVFVAPFFAETTNRFIHAVGELRGVQLGLVSQDALERLPVAVRAKLAAHWQIGDGLNTQSIADAVRGLARQLGPPARLIGALEQLQVPLAMVREKLGIEGMGVTAATNFRDKSRMKELLAREGLPCARHALVATLDQARAFAGQVAFPLVAKPPAGAGARETFRIDDLAGLEACLHRLTPSVRQPVLLEEFIVGEEHSFDTVCVRGTPVWHSLTHYSPGPLDVMRNPWIQWTVLLPREVDHPRYDAIRDVAFRSLAVLGMGTGVSHLEWFRRPDGRIAVSEVAARPPGAQFSTLISYAHDFDFYRAWARLMVFDTFEPPPRRYAAGLAFLRGQGRGRVRAVHGLERAQQELAGLVVEARLPQPGQPAAEGYEGEGWVILRHPETAVVERALRRVIETVRVELG